MLNRWTPTVGLILTMIVLTFSVTPVYAQCSVSIVGKWTDRGGEGREPASFDVYFSGCGDTTGESTSSRRPPGFSFASGKPSELRCRRLSLAIGTDGIGTQTDDGGRSYWASAIFGPDDSIWALVAESRFDGDAGSGDREAASGGAPGDGRRAVVAGSTITFAPTFTRS